MRALASAFSIKRGKSDDGSSTVSFNTSNNPATTNAVPTRPIVKSRSATLFAKAPKTPLETIPSSPAGSPSAYSLSPRPILTPASSSSSNESSSIRTPDDDGQMTFPSATTTTTATYMPSSEKKRWSSWFGLKKVALPDKSVAIGPKSAKELSHRHKQPHKSSLRQRPQQKDIPPRESVSDTDDDSGDESASSDSHPATVKISPAPPRDRTPSVITQAMLAAAQSNLRLMIRNSLMVPQCSPPPLVVLPSSPSSSSPYASAFSSASSSSNSPYLASNSRSVQPPRFPRSISPHLTSSFVHTFESTLHLRRMMRRLERRNLTHAEVRSIAVLGARPVPSLNSPVSSGERSGSSTSISTIVPDSGNGKATDDADVKRVVTFSRGLRLWCNRPCFEERMDVWTPVLDEVSLEVTIVRRKVMGVGRGLAVPELEFSEGLEFLAGLALDDATFERELLPPPQPPAGVLKNGGSMKNGK